MMNSVTHASPRRFWPLLPLLLSLGCALWTFWPTLLELSQAWSGNPQLSHGYLVPAFALILLWLRRDRLDVNALRPSWLGLPLLAAGIGIRLLGTYYYYDWLEAIALLPCLAGLCLLLGGQAGWRWAGPSLLFLAFMIPLPFYVASSLSGPLQHLATVSSTFVMQTLGLPALAEGNVILLNESQIGVVEACNGLSMLLVFFALAAAVAILSRRPWLERLLVVLSAIPIALVANILRITVTGILHEMVNSETANAFFHDAAGWLMMPIALAMLGIELKVLSHLFLDLTPARPRLSRIPALRQAPGQRASRGRPARTPLKRRERTQSVAAPEAEPQPTGEKAG